MEQEQIELSIIIVSWNTRDMLRECLELILPAASTISNEIIVVDNGSADGSAEMVHSDFSQVVLVRNSNNLGFPKAVNQGICVSKGSFIALVNSDIMVPPNAFEEMVSYLKKNPGVAAVGPQLIGRTGHMQYSGGYAPSPVTALMQLIEVQALAGRRSHGLFVRARPSNRPQKVDWLGGACMVIDRRAVDRVGVLDESHFMYAEDLEYGIRLRRAGWQLHLLPWVRVVHYGGASIAGAPEARLLWLGGVFRVAAGRLSWPSYFLFGLCLSAAYYSRYFLIRLMRSIALGDRLVSREVAHVDDVRLYGKTALKLSLRNPQHALDFCDELEKSYRKSTAKSS